MMNKNGNPEISFRMSDDDLRILERRVSKAIQEKDIAKLEKQFEQDKTVKRLPYFRSWRAAAIWIFLVSLPIFAVLFMTNHEKGIFKRYYAPVESQKFAGIYRGLASEMYTPYYLYAQGDYASALPRFRQYLTINPADSQARLLLAMCLIEGKDYAEAQTELTGILQSGNYFFHDDALWYLTLLAVREGQFDSASAYLHQIGNNSRYTWGAQALQKKIDARHSE